MIYYKKIKIAMIMPFFWEQVDEKYLIYTYYLTRSDFTMSSSGYTNHNSGHNMQVRNSSFECFWLAEMNYVSILRYKISRYLFIAS